MAQPQIIEGTWDELSQHADEFRGKRLRLTVLDEDSTAPQNLAEYLGDFIGCIEGSGDKTMGEVYENLLGTTSFEPSDLAARDEEYLATSGFGETVHRRDIDPDQR